MSTGTKAAATHAIWKRVSNCANARPRLASGASRCTMASKARRANAAATPTAPARSAALTWPPPKAASRPPRVMRTKASASIRSSCWLRRMIGPSALPTIVPTALNSSTRPNQTTEAFWLRSRKASWKVRKPTIARTRAMPEAASSTPADRSSSFSCGPAGVAATTSRRSRVARPVATM